jgi:hypothetical protein
MTVLCKILDKKVYSHTIGPIRGLVSGTPGLLIKKPATILAFRAARVSKHYGMGYYTNAY